MVEARSEEQSEWRPDGRGERVLLCSGWRERNESRDVNKLA